MERPNWRFTGEEIKRFCHEIPRKNRTTGVVYHRAQEGIMCYEIGAICQGSSNPFPFWLETLSIFLGDVLAVICVGIGTYIGWYTLKYPGFRVGANWTYIGWDFQKMGRLPNESDVGTLELMPNISVVSLDLTVRKVISGVWVRERADIHDPGEIHGHLDLKRAGVPVEVRTTGGDLLSLTGPKIGCQASEFHRIFHSPIFIQTSDGEFYQAESPGNTAKGIVKMRYEIQKFLHDAKRRLLRKLR
jgi:hypothetical protein